MKTTCFLKKPPNVTKCFEIYMKEGRPACVLLYTMTGADLYTISESTQAAEAGRAAGGGYLATELGTILS